MLRAERPRSLSELEESNRVRFQPRDVLLTVAPAPKAHSSPYSGWPNWLVPTYRSGGHRAPDQPLEDEG